MKTFEYRVCHCQYDRVTFVNEAWQGTIGPQSADAITAVETCPRVADYLQGAGREGWELVAVLAQMVNETNQQILYLKRESGG